MGESKLMLNHIYLKVFNFTLYFLILTLFSCSENQRELSVVKSISAMKNVMQKGELEAKVRFDTILPQKDYYGLGPIEGLTGEITIIDGIAYVSRVEGNTLNVDIQNNVGAPFFVYAISNKFDAYPLPKEVNNLEKLDIYLQKNHDSGAAFLFILKGQFEFAQIHVQNLRPGSKVSSPKEAHEGQVNFELNSKEGELIGFYSNSSQGVYTHHDTNIHTHFITNDKKYMGHCDVLKFHPGQVKLYISTNQ